MVNIIYNEERLLKSLIHGKLLMLYIVSLIIEIGASIWYIYSSLTGLDFAYKLLYDTFSLEEAAIIVCISCVIEYVWIYCNVNIPSMFYFKDKDKYNQFISKCWEELPYGSELAINSLPWMIYVGIVLIVNNI